MVAPHNSGSSSRKASSAKLAFADGMHLCPAAQATHVWLFSIGLYVPVSQFCANESPGRFALVPGKVGIGAVAEAGQK